MMPTCRVHIPVAGDKQQGPQSLVYISFLLVNARGLLVCGACCLWRVPPLVCSASGVCGVWRVPCLVCVAAGGPGYLRWARVSQSGAAGTEIAAAHEPRSWGRGCPCTDETRDPAVGGRLGIECSIVGPGPRVACTL